MSDTAASLDAARAGTAAGPGRGPARRPLREGQVAQLVVINTATRERRVVLETDRRIEAPNWTRDGRWLVVNGDGKLYTVAADGSGGPTQRPEQRPERGPQA